MIIIKNFLKNIKNEPELPGFIRKSLPEKNFLSFYPLKKSEFLI